MPITITNTLDADDIYNKLLKTKAFVVPENDPDRLKHWPPLGSKELEVIGIGKNESVADVVLSNAGNISLQQIRSFSNTLTLTLNLMKTIIVIGWIAIAGGENERISLKAWTPQGRGLHLRMPALLKKSVALRGTRVSDAPTYRDGYQVYKT